MKYLLLLLLFPFGASAQDTCGLKKVKDPFTNVTKLSTGFQNFSGSAGAGAVSISADASPTEIDFFIWLKSGDKCFDLQSEAEVIWEGERMKASLPNSGSINCEGAFHFSFKNTGTTTPSWLKRMMTKRVATIKLVGNGGAVTTLTFTEEQKVLFQKMVNCIVNEGKSIKGK